MGVYCPGLAGSWNGPLGRIYAMLRSNLRSPQVYHNRSERSLLVHGIVRNAQLAATCSRPQWAGIEPWGTLWTMDAMTLDLGLNPQSLASAQARRLG
jgi:hypothetical protein